MDEASSGSRLNPDQMPELSGLRELLVAAGWVRSVAKRDLELLVLWERSVRTRVLAGLQQPTTAPYRWRMPQERDGVTHRFCFPGALGTAEVCCPACGAVVAPARNEDLKGYITTGLYPDGRLGELFVTISKEGSLLSGVLDALAFTISLALQYGLPLQQITRHMRHTRFEPQAFISSPDEALRGHASSLLDYIARYLDSRFPNGHLARPQASALGLDKQDPADE